MFIIYNTAHTRRAVFVYAQSHNARLRGWQRITTKPKHNNCNHRGSMGLETPRVTVPLEAFVISKIPTLQKL
ncbi:hypothetical protein, partial [Vibrio cholerae]|uniref:hypothetical protein n=2 Tax=Vibrio cholerae TaxID=666 RepID=UPI001E4153E3